MKHCISEIVQLSIMRNGGNLNGFVPTLAENDCPRLYPILNHVDGKPFLPPDLRTCPHSWETELFLEELGIRGPAGPAGNDTVDIPAQPHQWPHVPGNLAIHMVNPDTVQLYWNAPTKRGGQVTSYRIYRKPVSDRRRLGDDYGHVLAPQTGNTRTVYTDVTAQPGVLYEYGVAAYRDGYPNPMSPISHRAYAQPW